MKNKMIVVFIAIAGMLLSACTGREIQIDETGNGVTDTNAPDESSKYDWQYDVPAYYPYEEEPEGDYIFNSSTNGKVELVLKRNVHTGECTTVCNDPFCTHDNPSCPFYITLYVVGIGNTMYGIRIDTENTTNYIYSYNVDTDEYKIVYKKDGGLYLEELFSYGKYLFFYESGAGIKRIDTVSGETVDVNRHGKFSFLRDGMIIWEKSDYSYVATDLIGNDPKPYEPLIYGGYMHRHEVVKQVFTSVYRMNRDGETETALYENVHSSMRVKDYIVYYGVFDDMEKHPINPDDPEEGETWNNGDIYYMPVATGESVLLCHVDGVTLLSDDLPGNHFVCGDWKGFRIKPTKQFIDKMGYEADSNDMVIVNVKTGEYHISRYME